MSPLGPPAPPAERASRRALAPPALAAGLAALWLVGCGPSEGAPSAERSETRLLDRAAPGADEAAAGGPLEVPADAPTVLFLGDSIGAGLHLPEDRAFPAVLERLLAAEGVPFRSINASESGRTTAGGVTALEWSLRSEPDLVVIELGGNDGLRGVALDDIERNLRTMIERSREAGAAVLLLGIRLPTNYGSYAERFDALYPRLAEEYDLAYVPFFMREVGGVPDMNLDDGLHPTAAGHERLAGNVLPALRRALEDLAATAR